MNEKVYAGESVAKELVALKRDNEAAYQELLAKMRELSVWKESFESTYKKSVDKINLKFTETVTKADLSKYHEEQMELLELKLKSYKNEFKATEVKIAELKDEKEGTAEQLKTLKKRFKSLEAELKEEMQKSTDVINKENDAKLSLLKRSMSSTTEMIESNAKDFKNFSKDANTRLEAAEEELKRVKSQYKELVKENAKLKSQVSELRPLAKSNAELLASIAELKTIVYSSEKAVADIQRSKENSDMEKKMKEMEMRLMENMEQLSAEKENMQLLSVEQMSGVLENIKKMQAEIDALKRKGVAPPNVLSDDLIPKNESSKGEIETEALELYSGKDPASKRESIARETHSDKEEAHTTIDKQVEPMNQETVQVEQPVNEKGKSFEDSEDVEDLFADAIVDKFCIEDVSTPKVKPLERGLNTPRDKTQPGKEDAKHEEKAEDSGSDDLDDMFKQIVADKEEMATKDNEWPLNRVDNTENFKTEDPKQLVADNKDGKYFEEEPQGEDSDTKAKPADEKPEDISGLDIDADEEYAVNKGEANSNPEDESSLKANSDDQEAREDAHDFVRSYRTEEDEKSPEQENCLEDAVKPQEQPYESITTGKETSNLKGFSKVLADDAFEDSEFKETPAGDSITPFDSAKNAKHTPNGESAETPHEHREHDMLIETPGTCKDNAKDEVHEMGGERKVNRRSEGVVMVDANVESFRKAYGDAGDGKEEMKDVHLSAGSEGYAKEDDGKEDYDSNNEDGVPLTFGEALVEDALGDFDDSKEQVYEANNIELDDSQVEKSDEAENPKKAPEDNFTANNNAPEDSKREAVQELNADFLEYLPNADDMSSFKDDLSTGKHESKKEDGVKESLEDVAGEVNGKEVDENSIEFDF